MGPEPAAAGARPARAAPSGNFRLNLRVSAPNQIFVSGMGLESEWEMESVEGDMGREERERDTELNRDR